MSSSADVASAATSDDDDLTTRKRARKRQHKELSSSNNETTIMKMTMTTTVANEPLLQTSQPSSFQPFSHTNGYYGYGYGYGYGYCGYSYGYGNYGYAHGYGGSMREQDSDGGGSTSSYAANNNNDGNVEEFNSSSDDNDDVNDTTTSNDNDDKHMNQTVLEAPTPAPTSNAASAKNTNLNPLSTDQYIKLKQIGYMFPSEWEEEQNGLVLLDDEEDTLEEENNKDIMSRQQQQEQQSTSTCAVEEEKVNDISKQSRQKDDKPYNDDDNKNQSQRKGKDKEEIDQKRQEEGENRASSPQQQSRQHQQQSTKQDQPQQIRTTSSTIFSENNQPRRDSSKSTFTFDESLQQLVEYVTTHGTFDIEGHVKLKRWVQRQLYQYRNRFRFTSSEDPKLLSDDHYQKLQKIHFPFPIMDDEHGELEELPKERIQRYRSCAQQLIKQQQEEQKLCAQVLGSIPKMIESRRTKRKRTTMAAASTTNDENDSDDDGHSNHDDSSYDEENNDSSSSCNDKDDDYVSDDDDDDDDEVDEFLPAYERRRFRKLMRQNDPWNIKLKELKKYHTQYGTWEVNPKVNKTLSNWVITMRCQFKARLKFLEEQKKDQQHSKEEEESDGDDEEEDVDDDEEEDEDGDEQEDDDDDEEEDEDGDEQEDNDDESSLSSFVPPGSTTASRTKGTKDNHKQATTTSLSSSDHNNTMLSEQQYKQVCHIGYQLPLTKEQREEEKWNHNFNQLYNYYEEYGTWEPHNNPQLKQWVKQQIRCYRNQNNNTTAGKVLSQDRYIKLLHIGFPLFSSSTTNLHTTTKQLVWDNYFNELVEYQKTYGTWEIDITVDKTLWEWERRIRYQYRNRLLTEQNLVSSRRQKTFRYYECLSDERYDKLCQIGYPFPPPPNETTRPIKRQGKHRWEIKSNTSWTDRLKELVQYHEQYGTWNVNYRINEQLYTWVKTVREHYRNRIRLQRLTLEEAQQQQNTNNEEEEEEEGQKELPLHLLGRKKLCNAEILSDERYQQLCEVGYDFPEVKMICQPPKRFTYDSYIELYVEYKSKHPLLPSTFNKMYNAPGTKWCVDKHVENGKYAKLAKWMRTQRKAYMYRYDQQHKRGYFQYTDHPKGVCIKPPPLSDERYHKLISVGFIFPDVNHYLHMKESGQISSFHMNSHMDEARNKNDDNDEDEDEQEEEQDSE